MTLSRERQSAQMSKITNDDLTRSDTGYFIAAPIWQHAVGVTELINVMQHCSFVEVRKVNCELEFEHTPTRKKKNST